ncbi:hypothetical protein B0H12DRAFT_1122206 [Mycena haematopus]|nr:hypothetical protein B0H12DRAFT_1122206 [Mycena haematopus]
MPQAYKDNFNYFPLANTYPFHLAVARPPQGSPPALQRVFVQERCLSFPVSPLL